MLIVTLQSTKAVIHRAADFATTGVVLKLAVKSADRAYQRNGIQVEVRVNSEYVSDTVDS